MAEKFRYPTGIVRAPSSHSNKPLQQNSEQKQKAQDDQLYQPS
jgi:hypothetical protein